MKEGNNILSSNPVLSNKILTWEVNEQFARTIPKLLSEDVEDRFFREAASANRGAAIRLFKFLQSLPGGAVEAGRLYQYIAQGILTDGGIFQRYKFKQLDEKYEVDESSKDIIELPNLDIVGVRTDAFNTILERSSKDLIP